MVIFRMSVSAVWLILFIILIRAVFYDVIPKITFSYAWGLSVVKLLIPIKYPILIGSNIELGEQLLHRKIFGNQNTLILTESPEIVFQLMRYFNIIWLIGVVAMFLYFVCVHTYWRKIYETALPVDNMKILHWKEKHKLLRNMKVVQLDRAITPLTYGVIRPCIVIPKSVLEFDKEQMEYILSHEYVHIRHFDVVHKSILLICLCIHWFNPFVWILYILANRDIERFCDECVIKEYGTVKKRNYALTLIEFLSTTIEGSPFSNGFCKKSIEERIISIMKIRKTTKLGTVVSIVLALGITFLTFSSVSAKESLGTQNINSSAEKIKLEIDDSIPTITLRENAINGDYSAVVNDENGNIIYKEENINLEADEAMKHIYEIVLNTEREERK